MKTTRTLNSRNRKRNGDALVEVLLGAMILVPIALGIIDISFLAIANTANDNLARNAARAAANQQQPATADDAATKVVDAFPISSIIPNVTLVEPIAFAASQNVTVKTIISVKMPVSFPGFDPDVKFVAQHTEACVGLPVAN
jgi:Tfp pilus assembly protein PilV